MAEEEKIPVPQPQLPTGNRGFAREDIERMTPEEINENWDAVREALMSR